MKIRRMNGLKRTDSCVIGIKVVVIQEPRQEGILYIVQKLPQTGKCSGVGGIRSELGFRQWRFYVGARGATASPVFGFAPPVWHDATKTVTMNNTTLLCDSGFIN